MMTSIRNRRSQTPSFNERSIYPGQHIVDSVETQHLSTNQAIINMDGAVHQEYSSFQQTESSVQATSEGGSTTAMMIRQDSFSRTRNEDDEAILMDEDEANGGDDEDLVVTRIRIEEDVAMLD